MFLSVAPWRERCVARKPGLQTVYPVLREFVPPASETTESHAALLARVARGDPKAMEACIEAYGGLVWTIVLRRVRDHSAAEDLTQEIFTEIWKSAGRHDPSIASESGFIGMIARRRAIDWNRKQQRLPAMETMPVKDEIATAEADPGGGIDRDTLWQSLKALPDETRRLFTLHFEEGLTHSEISEKTGLPLGSVKTRLRRGLIEARRLLSFTGKGMSPSQEVAQ